MVDVPVQLVVTASGIGRIVDGEVCILDLPYPDLNALLADTGTLACVRDARVVGTHAVDAVALSSPFGPSTRVWGVGLNSGQKLRATGRTLPEHPTLFLKPARSIAAPGADVTYPVWASREIDYEGEIAVVIGRTATRVRAADAWQHVAGITAANDLTARDVMRTTGSPLLAKGFDGFSPIGASVRECTEAGFGDVGLRCSVNGEERQRGNGSDLIYSVADLVERLSRHVTLLPGDVLLTGTPSGTGDESKRYLAPGDGLVDGPVDIGIRAGTIAAIEPNLDRTGAGSIVDGRGCHASAGFIDAHTHVFEHVSTVGAPVEAAHLRRGVVAVADAGTAGASTFSAFREYVVEPTPMRVLSFLNVSVLGLIDFRYGELLNPDTLQPEDALAISAANPGIVRGFKIRLSEDVVGGPCVPMLRTAVEIGESGGLPLMVHIGETVEPLPEVLDEMRAGDVVSHCYTGRKNGIVDDKGVLKEVIAARDRGVVFDSAHGRGNLSFAVARQAIDEGFLPDVLSSDTSARNWHGPVFDLATTMSKFLAMGLSLEQVVALVTEAPARLLGLWDEGFGRLEVGGPAHLTVFELVEESEFRDAAGATLRGPRLEPRWAFLDGEPHPADAWRGLASAT